MLEISYIPMILDVMYDKSKSFLTYLGEEAFRIDFFLRVYFVQKKDIYLKAKIYKY